MLLLTLVSHAPQTFAGGSYIGSKHPEGDTRGAVGTKLSIGTLPKSPSVYTNTRDYLIGDIVFNRKRSYFDRHPYWMK